jgi:hypothetical protein
MVGDPQGVEAEVFGPPGEPSQLLGLVGSPAGKKE